MCKVLIPVVLDASQTGCDLAQQLRKLSKREGRHPLVVIQNAQ
jgi:hypothetical protein